MRIGHVILPMRNELCNLHNEKTLFVAYNVA